MKKDEKDKKNEEELNDNKSTCGNDDAEIKDDSSSEKLNDEKNCEDMDAVKAKLENKEKLCEEYFGQLQRITAEFDNYKKRTAKEKEALYSDAVSDVISALLPVVDNFERALNAPNSESDSKSPLKEGIEMVYKQLKDVMKNMGIEEIKCVGESFNPEFHNAVMHIEDDSYGENVIVEEFQKGYIFKEKVIRHSMVKVAN
jgi:molecular chaperone GrpE